MRKEDEVKRKVRERRESAMRIYAVGSNTSPRKLSNKESGRSAVKWANQLMTTKRGYTLKKVRRVINQSIKYLFSSYQ